MRLSTDTFEFLLFSTDTSFIKKADQAGVHGFIVDWENKNKNSRQKNFDTQINNNTLQDLERAKRSTEKIIICRVNGFHEETEKEINLAINAGADEIFLPMVRTPKEVLDTLKFINGRCPLNILIETRDSVKNTNELSKLPLKRIYLGLNDLAIERQLDNIFTSLSDGTVEKVRSNFSIPFGFAGLTSPELGSPIPCRLLIAEMARLNAQFTFLRRSFTKDMAKKDMGVEVPRILQALSDAKLRNPEEIEADRQELNTFIKEWKDGFKTGEMQ